MKTTKLLTAFIMLAAAALLFAPATDAQTCDSTKGNFVDLNGDGYNDNAPDADGDGIPNGLDPDYIKSEKDGNGNQYRKGNLNQSNLSGITQSKKMNKFMKRNRFSTANQFKYQINGATSQNRIGSGVCDGTGPGSGSGTCDGTGPHGPKGK